MALDPLAVSADLDVRGIDISDLTLAETMLEVASASVRSAAQCPISRVTSTVTVPVWGELLLTLPGVPLVSVTSVEVDGDAVASTEYTVLPSGVWRATAWGYTHEPTLVEVEYTHGLLEVPADIVDLTCNLAAAGMAEARSMAAGGSFDPRAAAERIDDYYVQWAQGAEALGSVFDLPAGTRSRLRARFGGGAALVDSR